MASSRDYRKPRNQELHELLAALPSPLKICSPTGDVLWQNKAAEEATEAIDWIEQPVKWQAKKAISLLGRPRFYDEERVFTIDQLQSEVDELKEENQRLRRHQRSTARRKRQAEDSVKAREREASAIELREQKLRQRYETAELLVTELEEKLQKSEESKLSADLRLLEELEEIKKREVELGQKLAQSQADFARFRQDAEAERSKLELQEQLATKILELEALEQSFREEQRESNSHNQELKLRLLEQEEQLQELRQKITFSPKNKEESLSSDELRELRLDLEEAKSALAEASSREIRLMNKLDGANQLKEEQTKLLALVKNELAELRERESKFTSSEDRYASLEREVERARNEAQVARIESDRLRQSVSKLELELGQNLQELSKLRSVNRPASAISLQLPSSGGQELATPTVRSQLEFAQNRLRDTEKQLDQAREELKKARALAQSAKETEKLAYQDGLTGLPNRYMIERYLDYSHQLTKTHNRAYALFMIDLDGFRLINDTLGHRAGDGLLKAVGERLSAMRGSSHVVARDGQDRFLLLASDLERMTIGQFALEASRYLLEVLGQPFEAKGQPVRLTASIGVAMGPAGENVGEIFTRAESALKRVKEGGGGSFLIFDEALREKTMRDSAYARQMEQAIARSEVYALYQPVFELNKGKIAGVELLLRWKHRDQRILQPSDFLSLAIAEGMIFSIWETVWPKAFASLKRWSRQRPEMTLSINLSDRELLCPDLVERALSWLHQSGVNPSRVLFEVRDESKLRLSSHWPRLLGELSGAGFGMVLDDYGSPATLMDSLSYPGFKQAKQVVDDKNPRYSPSIDAAKDILYCAKRVQTRFDPKALRKAGFSLAQGFAVANPMSDADIDGLLR